MASRCILVVEDDELLRDTVVEALESPEHSILCATDGPQALAMIDQNDAIDVIFSDVSMPNGVSGIDLAFSVLARKPHIRVILASGYSKSQLPALPAGVSFLPKPYRIAQLLDALNEPTSLN